MISIGFWTVVCVSGDYQFCVFDLKTDYEFTYNEFTPPPTPRTESELEMKRILSKQNSVFTCPASTTRKTNTMEGT